ncbi:MAG: serine/threonine-protein kinase [Gemmatimonadaceae bacterium]
MNPNSRETPPPTVIADRYTVERVLGRGGMATVYLCTDSVTQDKVAVKVLREELGSAVIVERFLREIAFASELDHPRIPKVLDSGVIGSLPFYVMTYVEGESLRQRLDRAKQLPVEEAVRITNAVVEPMTYAHRLGIVHRDIKPGNILVGEESVYVLDFGIARAIIASAEDRLTSTGVAIGTPAYMSPEQALADGDLDARSDIYSLACVTYEMIAGMPPFVGATPQAVMARRFASPPPPLRETREGVSPQVEHAVLKALCKAPADRWQTARQFADALSETRESPSAMRQGIRLAGRRAKYAAGLGAAIVIMLGSVGAYSWLASNRDHVARSGSYIEAWDFPAAVAELRKGVERNPDDAAAQLWLAQMLMIEGAPAPEWRPFALHAADGAERLDEIDKRRAAALAELAGDTSPDPCASFGEIAASTGADAASNLVATLALAECMSRDERVLEDRSSPSGYRFRASNHTIAGIYEGLLARNPGNGSAYGFLMPRLEGLLVTSKNRLRRGSVAGISDRMFVGWPGIDGDTLAYLPFSIGGAEPVRQDAANLAAAVERNMRKLLELATDWTRTESGNPAAHETLARMLEATGKLDGPSPSAIEQIRIARLSAARDGRNSPEDVVRDLGLASTNVRLLLKLHRFDSAGSVADSALAITPPSSLPDSIRGRADSVVMGLAALTGRVQRVVEIENRHITEKQVHLSNGAVRAIPAEIGADANRLSIFSFFGGPADSIRMIADRISRRVTSLVPASQVMEIRSAIMGVSLATAATFIGPGPAAELGPTGHPFSRALQALARNDIRAARGFSDSLTALHAERAPGEITMDVVLNRAWLRAAIGDTTGAILVIDNALNGLSRASPNLLHHYTLPSALVRVMLFRSELAAARGDQATATKWAVAANYLWGRGDPEIVSRLKAAGTRR